VIKCGLNILEVFENLYDISQPFIIHTNSVAMISLFILGALSPGVKRSQGVMLTTYPLLMQRLRKSRSYTFSQPNVPLRSVTGALYLYLCCIG
jgi:hypothetical protein